jgi:drug/metabolite transporter (DMT)-like permease
MIGSEFIGVLAAVLSSAFGGAAGGVTRFVIHDIDPITLAAFRFGIGFLLLLPVTLALGSRWPPPRDRPRVVLLGLMFFAFFFILYNLSLAFTTAARGSLALSTLPVATMAVGAALGVEALTRRKTAGVLIAVAGVAFALLSGLAQAPPGAWRGDLIMIGATLCMALYNVWSRPFISRSSALGFLTLGMAAGAVCLVLLALLRGGFAATAGFEAPQWFAVIYLGAFGGAAAFYLWVFALERTTPTRVAITMTVNPIAASTVAALLIGEPIGLNLILGLIGVAAGIWIATSGSSTRG